MESTKNASWGKTNKKIYLIWQLFIKAAHSWWCFLSFFFFFTLFLWIILPSLPIHILHNFQFIIFLFTTCLPLVLLHFWFSTQRRKIKREERQAVFLTELAGEVFRTDLISEGSSTVVSFHNAAWCCDVKKITAGDSTLTGKIYPSFS